MNRFRAAAASGAIVALVASLVVANPVAAAPLPASPTVESVTFNGPHAFNLTGTAVGTVTVDVRIKAPDGQEGWCPTFDNGPGTPHLEFTSVLGSGSLGLEDTDRTTKLISGDCNDGVWRGGVSFTAWESGGAFKVSRVVATGLGGAELFAVDPSSLGADTTFTVSGGDPPLLLVSTRPSVVPLATYEGKVTTYFLLVLRDSKKRLSGRSISLCFDTQCGDGLGAPINFGSGSVVTTDATGRASKTWDYPVFAAAGFCQLKPGRVCEVLYDSSTMVPNHQRARVSASASPSTIPLGATTKLSGNSWPVSSGRTVVIQKWVNHAWVQLGRAHIRDSGRWDYTTRPGAKGNHVYRVWRPSSGCYPAPRCHVIGTTTGSISVTVR